MGQHEWRPTIPLNEFECLNIPITLDLSPDNLSFGFKFDFWTYNYKQVTTSFHLTHGICVILLSPKPIYRMSPHWTPPKGTIVSSSFLSLLFSFFWWQKPKITIQLAVMDGGHASRCSQLFLEFYLFIKSSNSCHIWISKLYNLYHILKNNCQVFV